MTVRARGDHTRTSIVEAANSVRIRLRYPSLDVFVERFASNVTRGGVFLASRNVQPVGSVVGFEIHLVDGQVALAGRGKVTWVKEFNPAEPTRPYGMGVQFLSIDPASKATLARILRVKEQSGPIARGSSGPHPTAVGAGSGPTNGKPTAAAVDTSVDLASEYGVDDAALRRVLDRNRRSGPRIEDDLSDLMKPDALPPATLAQALAELPRLVDPQHSRRRASGGFRPVDAAMAGVGSGPILARAPAVISGSDSGRIDSGSVMSSGDSGDSGGIDAGSGASVEAIPSESTDMTGGRDGSQPIAVGAELEAGAASADGGGGGSHGRNGGRHGRKRHR